MKQKSTTFLAIASLLLIAFSCNQRIIRKHGDVIDSFNGVEVKHHGQSKSTKRNTVNGYNVGLEFQCVEFVKRYYFQYYNHKMPHTFGHAKDFFQHGLKDGALNKQRNLLQFTNPSLKIPQVGDLLVFDAHAFNKYGHVAIVSEVNQEKKYIEIVQQNANSSKAKIKLSFANGKYQMANSGILGWLRMKD